MASKLGTLTLNLAVQIGQYTEGFKRAGDVTERESKRIEKSTNSATAAIKNLGVLALAGFSVDAIIGMADGYTQMAARIRNATDSAQEYNLVQDRLLATANGTYRALSEAQEVYLSLSGGMKSLGKSTSDTLDVADSLSYAFVANAARADQAQSAMDALNKSMAKGKIDADAWISIVSAADNIIGDMAKQTGRTEEEVRKLGATGKISLNELLDTLQTTTGKNKELADAMENSVADGFQKLSNSVTVYLGKLNESTGATGQIAGALGMLGDNIETVAESAMVLGAYWVGTYIPSVYASTTATIQGTAAKVADTTAARAKALADYDVAKANLASTAAMVRSMSVTNAQTAAMMTNARAAYQQAAASRAAAVAGTSALGLLGGPVGIGVTLAAVAAGYLLLKGSTDESTKSLRENNESVDDAIKKYKELDEVRRRSQLVSERDKLRDLGQEYEDINSKLITATYSFSRHNDMTSEQSKQVNALIAEYKKTGDIDKFSGKINALNFINETGKDKFNTLAGSVKTAGNEFKNQKSFISQMEPALKGVGDQAKQTAIETANLSEEIKKLLSINTDNALKSNYLNESVKRGVDPKLAEMLYEARSASGLIGSGKKLSDDVLKSVFDRWKADQGLNKTLEERAKIEERNKKLVEAQGNAMKVNALVASNAAKANYAALESAKGLPKGLLSAVNMTESPNSNTARSSAGARGAFQFMPKTADRFNVDVNSVNSSAKGAAEYLDKLLKMFEGNLENALRAYNWGEGNMQNYLKYGSGMKNGQKGYFADRPLPKETREYSGKVMGYMGGASGVSFTEDYSFDDWLKELEQFAIEREKREKEIAEKQKELALEVATYREKVNSELADKLEEIDKAGFDSAKTAELKAEYKKRAEIDIQVSEAAHSDKLAGYSDYLKSEEQLLNESFARRQRDLKLDLSLTAEQYTELSLALEKQRNKELQQAKWRALEARQAMADQIKSLASGSEDVFARASMAPQDYAKWSIENSRNNSQLGLQNDLGSVQRDIASSDAYSTDEERYQALLDAHEAYLSQKTALDIEYAQQVKDLETRQYESTMQMYGSLLSQAGAVWGDMTQMVKDSEGEQSSSYKAMFLAQQMFAIGSALVSTHLAATQVMTDPSALTLAQKTMYSNLILGMGYANVGLIAGQTIAGMAHDGIDNIPREGTWLLDKGERVVDSRTNGDLKDFIANGGSAPNVNVVVENYTSGQVQTKVDEDGRIRVIIREEIDNYIPGQMGNPSSKVHKAVVRNTTASTKR